MILILGSKGMLGGQLMKVLGDDAMGWDRSDIDVTDFNLLRSKIQNSARNLQAIINCIAYNDVDGAEEKKDLANKLNAEVPGELAKICHDLKITLVHFSTNYVFDGSKDGFTETDEPHPLSIYGQSKLAGELAVKKNTKQYYLVRTSVLFGPKGESELSKRSFVDLMLDLSTRQQEVKAVSDEVNSLTYVVDLAQQTKLLLSQKPAFGTYHITNSGQASWYDFAKEIFAITGKDTKILPVSRSEFPRKAITPVNGVLINTKLPQLRSWQDSLGEFLKAYEY